MVAIFDSAILPVNTSFGLGLRSPQADNTVPRHVASASDIDEQTAYSIRQTQLEESREAVMAAIRQADIEAELEWQAEVAEMATRLDAVCFA